MNKLKQLIKVIKGDYISVNRLAHAYEKTEEEAENRLNTLEDKDLMANVIGDIYVIDTNGNVKEIRAELSDWRNEVSEKYNFI